MGEGAFQTRMHILCFGSCRVCQLKKLEKNNAGSWQSVNRYIMVRAGTCEIVCNPSEIQRKCGQTNIAGITIFSLDFAANACL